VDTFIDKLADLLRSLMGEGGKPSSGRPAASPDPDLRDAWNELDDFMKGGTGARTGRPNAGESRQSSRPAQPADESLRPDYANLEVPFGADIETVRRSYKSLMLKYHPDKHSGDPEQHRIALEITKKINESFERIRSRHSQG
jgi:DnaJ-domain-containing protein 1